MTVPCVLIADALSERAAEILREAGLEVIVASELPDGQGVDDVIERADAILVRSATKLTAERLARATRVKIVGRAGIGVDNVDLHAASAHGVVVMNTPFGNATTTAEHAISMMMSVSRHIPQATVSMRAGRWDKKLFKGREITGKTLGVVGLGNIGRIVADRARGLRMHVVAFDPFLSAEAAAELGVGKVTLDQLLERSDYITIHTPLIPATRHLLGADAFAKVKPGVFLVHCARGGIVDEAALLEALDAGRVAGAALDVFETEPLPVDHPLRSHPKVVLTPHLGASTDEAQEAVATQIAEQVVAYFADGTLTNAVNAWSLSGDKQRALAPYLDLAARLGALAGQVHTGALEDVEVRFVGGPAAAERTPLVATLLSELMRVRVGAEVNPISARAMAADLGIALTVGTADDNAEFHNLIEVRVRGGGKASEVQGVVFGKQGCRVTSVDGYRMDLAPAGRILLVKNDDLPGIIGAVGGLLGDRGINVSGLVVGTKDGGGAALALWSVDQEVPAELVASLQRRPGIREVRTIRL